MNKRTFYVTTPIYYGTANPHLGSLYSTLIADVAARWNKLLLKKDVFFLTGTDEHGQKIAEAAQKAGKKPQEFVDSFIDGYKETWKLYHIDYTKFIRTTDEYHIKAVQHWLKYLQEKGDIYKGFYTGWYCTPCESFVTEKDKKDPLCLSCGRSTEQVSEETYFFKLSAYQDRLLEFYKKYPHFIIPKERLNEVTKFVESGLKDLSISRTTVTWGVPFPDDNLHVAYVWADALNNYITAVGYAQEGKEEVFNKWWPADLQVLGKDIIKFHAVYWPAFLMASGLNLSHHLLVHGWIKISEKKMSKSFGNVVDPVVLAERYGTDAVRYYLMRYMAVTHDSNFSTGELEQVITSDLAHDLGNLLNRMLMLAEKHKIKNVISPQVWTETALALHEKAVHAIKEMTEHMHEYQIHLALAAVWKFINQINAYFHAQEPWKLAKNDPEAFMEVLAATCSGLRLIAFALWPVMPQKMEDLLHSLGVKFELDTNIIEELKSGLWIEKFTLTKRPSLFEQYENNTTEDQKANKEVSIKEDSITIDDLTKVQLVVGTIVQSSAVDKSDKLLQLQVDFGPKGTRQILAGIKNAYKPEDLVGKQAVFVLNLKPRKMLGLESQGMMLLVLDAKGVVKIVAPTESVPAGTRLR